MQEEQEEERLLQQVGAPRRRWALGPAFRQLITAALALLLPSLIAFFRTGAGNSVLVVLQVAIRLISNFSLMNVQVVIDMVGMQQLVLSIKQNGLQHTQAAYAAAGGVIRPGATSSGSNYIAGLLLSATEQHVQQVSTSSSGLCDCCLIYLLTQILIILQNCNYHPCGCFKLAFRSCRSCHHPKPCSLAQYYSTFSG
jgi:hypothetical protein